MNQLTRAVNRGIQSVRAEDDSIAGMMRQLNAAFEDFKADHNGEVRALRTEIDALATQAAARQMGGATIGADPNANNLDGANLKVLRTADDFQAHYATKARDSDGGSPSPVAMGEFMKGVAGIKTTESAIKAMSVGTNTAGGYAVPDILMPKILSAMVPASSLLQAGAGFVPLETGAKSVTTAVVDTLPTASWRLEEGNVAQSEPTFRAVVAKPKSLACVIKVSRELLADGDDIDHALRFAIAQAFAKEVDRVGLRGTGTDPEPRGILNTVGVNAINLGANGAAPANYRHILQGYQAILEQNGPRPTSAIMAPRSLIGYDSLADTTGQPLNKPSLVEPLQFLATSQIPTDLDVGTSTDCSELYLADFAGMYFLLRENLSIQLLREAYAGTGHIGFLCHARIDVVIPYPKAFSVITGIRPVAE
jgi:HK97 family phage major capsid protein